MTSWDRYYDEKINKEDYRETIDYEPDCDYDYFAEQEHMKKVLNNAKAELEDKLYEILENVNQSLENEEIQKTDSDLMIQETIKEMTEHFYDVKVNISNNKKLINEKL